MSAIAVITARGGSKRIPGKNKKEFLGKPIICYSIEAALDSGLFEEVMVSTDDEEIAEIARKSGAKVPFLRSAAASDDCADGSIGRIRKKGKEICIYGLYLPNGPFCDGGKTKGGVSAAGGKSGFRGYAGCPFFFSAPAGNEGERRPVSLLLSGKRYETFSGFGAGIS